MNELDKRQSEFNDIFYQWVLCNRMLDALIPGTDMFKNYLDQAQYLGHTLLTQYRQEYDRVMEVYADFQPGNPEQGKIGS